MFLGYSNSMLNLSEGYDKKSFMGLEPIAMDSPVLGNEKFSGSFFILKTCHRHFTGEI